MNRHLLMIAFLACGSLACSQETHVPTVKVERQAFSHQITVEGTLQAAQATTLNVPSGIRNSVRLAWLEQEGVHVKEGQLVARFDPKPMEEELEEGNSNLHNANLRVGRSKIDSDSRIAGHVTEQRVAEIELDYSERYQKVDEGIFSRNEIVESRIDHELASHRKDHASGAQEIQRQLAATELELLAIDQRRAQTKIDRAKSSLEALEVRAPHDGILSLSKTWTGEPISVGIEMWQGQPIGEIPNLDRMEAEVFVLEADAGGLGAGKSAELVLEARPEKVYQAKIKRIDAVAKPRFRDSPVQYFGVTLEFERRDGEILKPGQRVRATLMLEQVDDALVVPRQTVFQAGDEHFVYLHKVEGFAPRRVEIATSSISEMVIQAGLEPGDKIALTRPANAPDYEPEGTLGGSINTAQDETAQDGTLQDETVQNNLDEKANPESTQPTGSSQGDAG